MPEFVRVESADCEPFRARLLDGFWDRLWGLLGERDPRSAPAAVLCRCSSIHTFGMAYDLDVCLVDGEGRTVASRRGVGPGSVVSKRGAEMAIERPARDGPWIGIGSSVSFAKEEADDAL